MGIKAKSRILAVLIAVALIATSGIGVFASDSPVNGKISGGNAIATSTKAGVASWSPMEYADHYIVYLKDQHGKVVTYTVKAPLTNINLNLQKDKHYVVQVQAVNKSGEKSELTTIGHLCTYKKANKVKAKRAGKRKIKVSWKKAKGRITGYRIAVYENGKYLKTVKAGKKATSKTIKKLKKGAKYTFTVYPICENAKCEGVRRTSKTVKCK